MLTAYAIEDGTAVARAGVPGDADALRRAVWIDLLDPAPDEVRAVEAALRLGVPTREEMQAIEASSRLHRDGEALFLTTPLFHRTEAGGYGSSAATFVLTPGTLVTVRHATPRVWPISWPEVAERVIG